MNNDWLQVLKAGDEVIVEDPQGKHLRTVAKVTATMIVTKCGRYRRSTGNYITSDPWAWAHLRPVTEDALKEIRQIRLASKMGSVKWNDVSLDKLERVVAILAEGNQP